MNTSDHWESLGTPGRQIEIADYNPGWPLAFEREASAILEARRSWVVEVHHVGSTSVPGLAAKPVLDMLPVAAGPAEALEAVHRMVALGYRYRGENGIPGRLYFQKDVDGRDVAHVHMFPVGHPAIRTHLAFRDHLRTHPETARDYERLKRELAAKHVDDREAYTDAKAGFIEGVIAIALGDRADRS
ncbi:MAG: GrpB family protein [Chloroflexi bacterium]|nr:GrpB family protein [Chloroflexota bacterium]